MVRSQRIEAENYRTRNEMRGVQLEVIGCKKSVEKFLERMNATFGLLGFLATESNFNEWRTERKDLKNEIETKKVNDE